MKVSNSVFLLTIAFLCCIEAGADVFSWLRWKLALGTPAAERSANKLDKLIYSATDSNAILTGSSLFLYPAFSCDRERSDKANDMNNASSAASIANYSSADCLEEALSDKNNEQVTVVNLATGGALMSDQYLVLKNWLLRGKRPKYAICDVSPREFLDNFQVQFNRTATCRALPEGFSFAEACGASLAANEILSAGNFESVLFRDRAINRSALLKSLPVLAKRPIFLWESAGQREAPCVKKDLRTSNRKSTTYGGCGFGSMVQNNSLLAYYRNAYLPLNVSMYAKQMYFMAAYTKLAKKNGIKVFFVMVPLPENNIEILPLHFRRQFEADVMRIAQRSGAELLYPAKQFDFDEHDFEDPAHMNARGGMKLFSAIAASVGESGARCLKN